MKERRLFKFTESVSLRVDNPINSDPGRPFCESMVSDLDTSSVRAVFPLSEPIHSNKMTRNFTLYPAKSLIGNRQETFPTGYSSFVRPTGKPIITEHRLQDSFLGPEADVPLGRYLFCGYKKRGSTEPRVEMPPGIPGSYEGDGNLLAVFAITHPEGIERVMGGIYHTISIGSYVDSIIESISGVDLVQAWRNGDELPEYQRGMTYVIDGEAKLSYWIMGEVAGQETSYVNAPADELARNIKKDIGIEGVRLMLAQKQIGKESYSFFDARNETEIPLAYDEGLFDTTFSITDSLRVGENISWLNKPRHVESVEPNANPKIEAFVTKTIKESLRK